MSEAGLVVATVMAGGAAEHTPITDRYSDCDACIEVLPRLTLMRLSASVRLVLATASVGAMFAVPAAGAGARDSDGIVFMCGRNTLDLCLARP